MSISPPSQTTPAKPRKRRMFGPLLYCSLALLFPALIWRFGVGGWEGLKDYRDMRRLAYEIKARKGAWASANALWRYGEESRVWFLWMLDDPNPGVRELAAFSLSRYPKGDRKTFECFMSTSTTHRLGSRRSFCRPPRSFLESLARKPFRRKNGSHSGKRMQALGYNSARMIAFGTPPTWRSWVHMPAPRPLRCRST